MYQNTTNNFQNNLTTKSSKKYINLAKPFQPHEEILFQNSHYQNIKDHSGVLFQKDGFVLQAIFTLTLIFTCLAMIVIFIVFRGRKTSPDSKIVDNSETFKQGYDERNNDEEERIGRVLYGKNLNRTRNLIIIQIPLGASNFEDSLPGLLCEDCKANSQKRIIHPEIKISGNILPKINPDSNENVMKTENDKSSMEFPSRIMPKTETIHNSHKNSLILDSIIPIKSSFWVADDVRWKTRNVEIKKNS